MFNKVLIANRGEIAVRIIRACRELGVRTVAVFSEADRGALHAQIADEAVCIGPAATKDSYLNVQAILAACELTGANAVHPGFGFLSENAAFARNCEKCGVTFIGPDAESMEMMGDKATAKQTMRNAGVPVVPGSDGVVKTPEEAKRVAKEIGYPVMIKASAGGGGRGIRLVHTEEELEAAMVSAQQEALSFFANDEVYIEKFIVNPRHVEIQILADSYGNVVHLGERDCSMQRRNQKVLEESPCPVLPDGIRRKMGEAAVAAAKACGYKNAGTIEFLLAEDGQFYFMEMNTRIQVEHGVTEMVTGIDLIKEQIFIAAGEKLRFKQKDIHIQGHAIECRLNAENPEKNFMPCPGKIEFLHLPGGNGVRIDSAIYAGYQIPPNYDSMIAKIIVYGKDRDTAIDKMRSALGEVNVEGITTNLDYQYEIINHPVFRSGDVTTGFLEEYFK